MKKIKRRIVLVDKRPLFKEELSMDGDPFENYFIAGIFKDVKSAYHSLMKSRPEAMVITVEDYNESILGTIAKIKSQYPAVRILIQSDTDDEYIFNLLTIGLAGFTRVPNDWNELIKTLDDAMAGLYPVSGLVTRKIFEAFQLNKYAELSSRQNEILRLMLMGGTYNTIAGKLQISKETAKTHMKNLYRKLHVHSKEQALAKAINDKLIFVI
jgi:DNA-binding NarL/FixJ family response regulator